MGGYILPYSVYLFHYKPFIKLALMLKRFFNWETIRVIRMSLFAEIPLNHDWLRSLNYIRVNYLNCNDQWKTFDLFSNLAQRLFLYYKISFSNALRERLVEEGGLKFVEMFFGFSLWLPSRKNCFGSLNCPTCRITSYTLRSCKSGFTIRLSNLIVRFLVGKKGLKFLGFKFVWIY